MTQRGGVTSPVTAPEPHRLASTMSASPTDCTLECSELLGLVDLTDVRPSAGQ